MRRLLALALPALFLSAAFASIANAHTKTHARSRTMVSIEFDDAYSDQWKLRPLLASYGVPATFFLNSALLGTPGYMSVGQLLALQGDGHEMAGHTRHHYDLPGLPAAQQIDEICGDRELLRSWDLAVSDFAYPNASFSPETQSIVASCGYRSARTVGGLTPPPLCGRVCRRPADTVPPVDLFATLTVPAVDPSIGVAVLEKYVLGARRLKRGWVQFVFHHVCESCNSSSVRVQTLTKLLAWLRTPKIAPTVRVLRVDSVVALRGRARKR